MPGPLSSICTHTDAGSTVTDRSICPPLGVKRMAFSTRLRQHRAQIRRIAADGGVEITGNAKIDVLVLRQRHQIFQNRKQHRPQCDELFQPASSASCARGQAQQLIEQLARAAQAVAQIKEPLAGVLDGCCFRGALSLQ